jgi:pheromone shutdown protein TraB
MGFVQASTLIPLLWLRLGEIVVSSRDNILAHNIIEACERHQRDAVAAGGRDAEAAVAVVAVLGVLHCNGVAAKVALDNIEA